MFCSDFILSVVDSASDDGLMFTSCIVAATTAVLTVLLNLGGRMNADAVALEAGAAMRTREIHYTGKSAMSPREHVKTRKRSVELRLEHPARK